MIRPDETTRCGEVMELLEPYLDGDLAEADAARVRAHLVRCPSCAAELDLAAAIQRELRSLPQEDCPPEVLERVLRSGRGEVIPFRPRYRPFRIALAAAMLVAVLGTSVFLVRQQQSGDQPSTEEVAQATREARFAVAYVGKVSRQAGLGLRDEVFVRRLVAPTTRSVRELGSLAGADSEQSLDEQE